MPISINGTTGITSVDGSASIPSHKGSTGGNTAGIYYPASNTFAITTSGTEALRVDSSGNLGIGTASPSTKLDVNGASVFRGNLNITNGYQALFYNSDSTNQFTLNNVGAAGSANAALSFVSSGVAERMRINANGDITAAGTLAMGTQFSFRNKMINGGFDVWQRGTSSTDWAGDFALLICDRYRLGYDTGSIPTGRTISRQEFTLGQTDVPGDPRYYFQYTFPNLGTPSNYLRSDIVDPTGVRMLAGKTCTLSFWAKCASGTMAIGASIAQEFGSGGSPSAGIYPSYTAFTATTTWQRFTITRTLSSITGKTLGSNNDSRIWPYIILPTNAAGTINLANLQLEEGSLATPFERKPFQVELAMCQRYYEKSYNYDVFPGTLTFGGAPGSIGRMARPSVSFRVEKAIVPNVTIYNPRTGASGAVDNNGANTAVSAAEAGTTGFCLSGAIAAGTDNDIRWQWVAVSEP